MSKQTITTARVAQLLQSRKNIGESVGKALVLSLINDILNPGTPPLLAQESLDRALDRILMETDQQTYNAYAELYATLPSLFTNNEALNQQAQNGYYRLINVLIDLLYAEDFYRLLESLPDIVMPEEVDAMTRANQARAASRPVPYGEIILQAVRYYLRWPEDGPQSVRDTLAALAREPFTREDLIPAMPGLWDAGHHPPMTLAFGTERMVAYCHRLYQGLPAPEAMLTADRSALPAERITKLDVLQHPLYSLLDYYDGSMTGDIAPAFADFRATFPALYDALRADAAARGVPIPSGDDGDQAHLTAAQWQALSAYGFSVQMPPRPMAVLEPGKTFRPNIPPRPLDIDGAYSDPDKREIILASYEELLIPSLVHMGWHNAILAALAEAYSLPEINLLALEPDINEERVQTLNDQIALLCRGRQAGLRTPDDARRALMARTMFPMVDLEALRPGKDRLAALRARLRSQGAGQPPPPVEVLEAILRDGEEAAHG